MLQRLKRAVTHLEKKLFSYFERPRCRSKRSEKERIFNLYLYQIRYFIKAIKRKILYNFTTGYIFLFPMLVLD